MSRRDDLASWRAELIGWLMFVAFAYSVWRLRERLNRWEDDG